MPQPVNVIPTKSAIVFAQAQEAERKALQAFFDGQSAECCSLLNSAVSYARQLNSDVEDPAIAEGLVRVYLNRCLYYFVSTAIDRLTDADWQAVKSLVQSGSFLLNVVTNVSSDILLKMSCFSGLSAFHLNALEAAKTAFEEGKRVCVTCNSSQGYVVPGFGCLASHVTWDTWLKKCQGLPEATPSSSKKLIYKKDWNAIEKEIEKELQEDEENQMQLGGEDSFQKLLRNIYAQADDDTRRAMMKSYETSAGTVLSTNWSDVSKKDYAAELGKAKKK